MNDQAQFDFAAQVRRPDDICRNRHGRNAQSEKANERAAPRKESTREKIYRFIHQQSRHGATCEEVEIALHLRHQSASARLSELKRDQRVHDSGRERATETGAAAAVFITDWWFGNQSEEGIA